ncbi:ester cyclase [Streptacidiphilus cavernicola]|uniref:Ester cyclase n=1 Tax=Streptacidiphilus cavernicola TaxID=3342716 RepID=A0ABV6VQW9_9ACTN
MSTEVNKSLALRYFNEVFNKGDIEALEEITASDFVFTMPTHDEPFRGVDGYKGLVDMLRGCFPDIQFAVEDMVAEADRVMTRWTARGNHTGIPFPTVIGEVPAAGNQFHIEGMTWHQITDGKISQVTANEDGLGLITQLGRALFPGQSSATPVPGSPEDNKAVVGRYFDEIMGKGDLAVIDELMTPDFSFHIPTLPDPVRGPEGMKQFVTGLRTAFPDAAFAPEYMIADGHRVAVRYQMTGTQKGSFLGAPASGNFVKDDGTDLFHLSGGRIVAVHVAEDGLGLLQQLGVLGAV